MTALLTAAPRQGTVTSNFRSGVTAVPTLRDLFHEQLRVLGVKTPKSAVIQDKMSLARVVQLLQDLGIEPDRVLMDIDNEAEVKPPTFAGRLRLLRQKANLSQESLAKKIEVPTGTVTQWETGRRTPNLKLAVKIAKALNTDLNVFSDCDWGEDEKEEDSDKSDESP